ncbi:hypothetical protein [Moritella viscosa]|uniref:Uncharacterized protein n=1 Tax=Moritella viscosa TaxID=80854 RepID=A0ABY1HFM5_9GAMM|nr:hypothetical protein [Moritella viscosa]SGY93998.1 Putative uncharacterized protein [Moritella viscosa]SGZ05469.1 Putative uncharacterized protein [Moritella viscosa]SGZ07701.1 Putative uncharacterized protein [Moritella viscosa]SGZ10512.1 Putative uncharacterized protein [Moritella viscosa]SHO26767.1 Putative uncharacterized protein [Moritella viscosa]
MLQAVKLVFSAGSFIFRRVSSKQQADAVYKVIVPQIKSMLLAGKSINDSDVKEAIELLKTLPDMGAKRRNFYRKYLRSKDDILRLPDTSNRIMFGYWW